MNQYGKREYAKGKFHALDAARMAILGYVQSPIETFISNVGQVEPVYDVFMSEW